MKKKARRGKGNVVGYRVSFRPTFGEPAAGVRDFLVARHQDAHRRAELFYWCLRALCPDAHLTTDYLWEGDEQ